MAGKIRIGPLETPIECRREMGRVYKEARNGRMETQDASRLCNILNLIIGAIRDTDLERRISELEAANGKHQ
jgi:hypothetical protein